MTYQLLLERDSSMPEFVLSHVTRLLKKKDNMNRLQLITNKLYNEMFRTAKTVNKVRQYLNKNIK